MQEHEDVPYRVSHISDDVYQTWTRTHTPDSEPSCNPNQDRFIHPDRLLGMRNALKERPLISPPELINLGRLTEVIEETFGRECDQSQLEKKAWKIGDKFAKKASKPETLKEMQRTLDTALARLAEDEGDSDLEGNSNFGQPPQVDLLSAASFLATTRIGGSASSKLNFIINEVILGIRTLPITNILPYSIRFKLFLQRKK